MDARGFLRGTPSSLLQIILCSQGIDLFLPPLLLYRLWSTKTRVSANQRVSLARDIEGVPTRFYLRHCQGLCSSFATTIIIFVLYYYCCTHQFYSCTIYTSQYTNMYVRTSTHHQQWCATSYQVGTCCWLIWLLLFVVVMVLLLVGGPMDIWPNIRTAHS